MDLGIILFTGRSVEELSDELKTSVDLIIDGRFIESKRDHERNLVGSTNQRIIDVSSRYSDNLDWFNNKRTDFIEIDVVDGCFITNGSSF